LSYDEAILSSEVVTERYFWRV